MSAHQRQTGSTPPSAGPRSTGTPSAGPRSTAPPRRRWHLLRSDAFPLVLVLLLSLGGLVIVWSTTASSSVHFVNALADTLTMEVDGATFEVPTGGHVERRLDIGLHQVRVRAGQQTLEESVVYVPRFHDALVYDPLGLQIIARRHIRYSTAASTTGNEDDAEIFAGRRWVVIEDADYVFRDPPRQISTKRSSGSIAKTWVHAPPEFRWTDTLGYLLNNGEVDRTATILERWAAAPPGWAPPDAQPWMRGVPEMARGPGARLEALRRARDQQPTDRELHGAYQEAMLQLGRRRELLEEYRQRAARAPDSAMEALMRWRIEPMAESDGVLDEALTRFPDDLSFELLAAARLFDRGDVAASVAAYAAVPPERADGSFLGGRVQALLAAGRAAEALAVTEAMRAADPEDVNALFLRAQLAALPGVPAAESKMPDDPATASLLRTILGGPPPASAEPNALERAASLQALAQQSPGKAREALPGSPPASLRSVHRGLSALLVAELERLGDWREARRLRRAAMDARLERGDLLAFLFDGVDGPQLLRLDDEARAALDVVRARVLLESGDAQGAKRLLASARKRDGLQGPVTRAAASWPAPADSDEGLVVFAWRPAQR